MSYVYCYFYDDAVQTGEPALALIHRYRMDKSPGNSVYVLDRGAWSLNDPDSPEGQAALQEWPQFHVKGYNTLHLDGRVNFVNDNVYRDSYELEILKLKYPSVTGDWGWNPKFGVLDNL